MHENVINHLREIFGSHLQENVCMANYTTMGVGGKADALIIINTASELENVINKLTEANIPFIPLGSGSNVLVSDKGVREVVLINRAHNMKIITKTSPLCGCAESGTNLAQFSRQLGFRGLSGLEWASAIPGTVGGAVYGNAGAFGRDISCNLFSLEIMLPQKGKETWSNEKMEFSYRSSILKRQYTNAVILSAIFHFEKGDAESIKNKMEEFKQRRAQTQPPGPSLGSIFRNPPEEKAGRLIEAVGLKGKRIGNAEISPMHANFIINTGGASAMNILDLITTARDEVEKKFNIRLIPEIQIIGEWEEKYQSMINQINSGRFA